MGDEVIEEHQKRLIGPVHILEDQDGRSAGRERLQRSCPRGEVLLARRRRGLQPEERAQTVEQPRMVVVMREHRVEAGLHRGLVRRFQDSGVTSDDFARAEKVAFSPYGRQRPSRQVTISGRLSSVSANSATRRLFPMPGSPASSANRGVDDAAASSRSAVRRASSSSRPMSGERSVRSRSAPVRATGARASQAATGSDLPLAATGGSGS